MTIVWSDDFKIGIEELDYEHKVIIDEYVKLYNLMKKGSGHSEFYKLIDVLERHVNTHIKNEEKLQERINYPEYEEHKRKHKDLKVILKKYIITIRERKITDLDLIKINRLFQMFINHILTEDVKIGDYMRKMDGVL